MSDFDDLAEAYAATNPAAIETAVPGVVGGDDARQILTFAIQTEVLRQELAENGSTIEQGAIDAEAAAFAESDPASWDELPENLRTLFATRQAAINGYIELVGTPEAEIEARYDQGIATSGIACVSHILVENEADAEAALARLDDGEDFATVASEVSTDGSAAGGGALSDPTTGAACSDAATFSASYIPVFVDAALGAEVGVPTAPVESEFGFHVILVRPFAEVSAEVVETIRGAELAPRAAELFGAVDVSVSPSIGTWSPASNSVEPLDSPLAPA